ncbi:hypothetical protein [Streptococcus constellatus]|uniref:hypothetical protein n=1 Tax=Streptococcus constellatus TaxID=76860 RepID=UPI0018974EC2|nr:hypothetical protein [Streptococcus constellatus]
MIANIRVHADGQSRGLCQLDLMKFSEDQVRERMEERGFSDESFFICGFSDWEVDSILSLDEAYLLKKMIVELYDGDDFIVVHLLKNHKSFSEVVKHYYRFLTKDEVQLMKILWKNVEIESVVDFFYQVNNWVSAVQVYVEKGVVLNTSKGFYIDFDYSNSL